jgi:WD40 repeat protein
MLLAEHHLPLSPDIISPAVLGDFAPDGQRLAARHAGDQRTVQIWNVLRRGEPLALRGLRWPVFALRFSPDGRRVAAAGCDRTTAGHPHEVKVWDAITGKELATLTGQGHVFNLVFSHDGRWLALGGENGQVTVLDWTSGEQLMRQARHKGPVTALAFSRDGKRLATAGANGRTVKLWDCATWQVALRAEAPGLLCDLTFSPDGERLAGISRDLVRVWDAGTGHDLLTLRGAPQRHRDPAFNPRLAFSPDGRRLAGSNWDESISVWDAEGVSSPGQEAERGAARQEARRRAAEERAPVWHLQEGERCVFVKNPFAAAFHLRQVVGPLPGPLQERRALLERELASMEVTEAP